MVDSIKSCLSSPETLIVGLAGGAAALVASDAIPILRNLREFVGLSGAEAGLSMIIGTIIFIAMQRWSASEEEPANERHVKIRDETLEERTSSDIARAQKDPERPIGIPGLPQAWKILTTVYLGYSTVVKVCVFAATIPALMKKLGMGFDDSVILAAFGTISICLVDLCFRAREDLPRTLSGVSRNPDVSHLYASGDDRLNQKKC